MSANRANWYGNLLALRAALERRGKFTDSRKAHETALRTRVAADLDAYIERVRREHNIPYAEVYGSGDIDESSGVPET